MKQQEKTILERRKHIEEILSRDDANVVYFLERYLTKTIESERERVVEENKVVIREVKAYIKWALKDQDIQRRVINKLLSK